MDTPPPKLKLARPVPLGFRIIGAFKSTIALLLIAAALGILRLVHKDLGDILQEVIYKLHLDPENRLINMISEHVLGIDHRHMQELGIGTFCYALLYGAEGIGLFLGAHWAEYLIIGTTAFFLPLEIYEIFHRFGPIKLGIFVINMAIMIYFLRQMLRERKERRVIEEKALQHVVNSPEAVVIPPANPEENDVKKL
jgi:uncharacterized membrane protein (DUF2068 family)